MKPFRLPENLKLGSATAATQIEGDDGICNWSKWAAEGNVRGCDAGFAADDHWNRYVEDTAIMKELNHEVYRMSIEWSRVEPEEGVWSREGLDHYVDEISRLRDAGIDTLVTLHHFSAPQWLQDQGAWENKATINKWLRFTGKMVTTLGNLVSEYCTINEPNVFVNDTYMDCKYPGGKKGATRSYFKAARNLVLAHLKGYRLIHRLRAEHSFAGETKVGFAHHIAHFEVVTKNPLTRLSERMMDWSFHEMFFRGMIEGRMPFPLGFGRPEGKGVFCDFLGVNYYSRHIIKSSMNPAALFGEVTVEDNLPDERVSDLGWEIYPAGLSAAIRRVYDKYRIPVYITENGIANADDTKRTKYIYDHLKEVADLCTSGVDVRRFYYWSLMDNLEWDDGYGPRFGLVEINYETQERRIRPSARFYADVIRDKGVTEESIQNHFRDIQAPVSSR